MTKNTSKQRLLEILDIARLAPSVHNTQPWVVTQATANVFSLSIDDKHALADGDPTGRQTIISLGIFTEAICVAFEAVGLKQPKIKLLNRQVQITHDGLTEQTQGLKPQNSQLLRKRATDRSLYKPVAINQSQIDQINSAYQSTDVHILTSTDKKLIKQLANFTSKGIKLALSNPGFRKELSQYLITPSSRHQRGISVKSLYISRALAKAQPHIVKLGLGQEAEARLERRRWLSASGVVIITGKGDMPKYWFEAGRAYLRASLAIEKMGLSQATSAAIVEASNFHEDVETLLGTDERILALMRIGRGRKKRYYSPRVSAQQLLH